MILKLLSSTSSRKTESLLPKGLSKEKFCFVSFFFRKKLACTLTLGKNSYHSKLDSLLSLIY